MFFSQIKWIYGTLVCFGLRNQLDMRLIKDLGLATERNDEPHSGLVCAPGDALRSPGDALKACEVLSTSDPHIAAQFAKRLPNLGEDQASSR